MIVIVLLIGIFTLVLVFWSLQYRRTKKKILSILRQNPEKWFTAMELVNDYKISLGFTHAVLGEACGSGLVDREETDFIYPGTNTHRPAYKIKG